MKDRIVSFDGLRLFFILGVVLFHCDITGKRVLSQGYLAVEGFFVLSGFLLAHSYFKNRMILDDLSLFKKMVWRRIKRLYPEYLFATVLVFIIYSVFFRIHGLSDHVFFNLIMFGHCGVAPNIVDGTWYVGALFWGSFVLLALIIKYRESFIIIAPLLFLSCIILLFHNDKTSLMYASNIVLNLFPSGFLRAVAGLTTGTMIYYVYQKRWLQNKILNIIILVIALICTCFLLSDNSKTSGRVYNVYFLASFLILSCASLDERLRIVFDNKFFQYLSKIIYMCFLTNILVLKIIAKYVKWPCSYCGKVLFAVFSCFAFAAFCYHISKWLFAKLKQILFVSRPSQSPQIAKIPERVSLPRK